VMRGLVTDEGGYLGALADAERLLIGLREVSLQPPSGPASSSSVGGIVPGTVTSRSSSAGSGAATASSPAPGM